MHVAWEKQHRILKDQKSNLNKILKIKEIRKIWRPKLLIISTTSLFPNLMAAEAHLDQWAIKLAFSKQVCGNSDGLQNLLGNIKFVIWFDYAFCGASLLDQLS